MAYKREAYRSLRFNICLACCYGPDVGDELKGDVDEWADVDGLGDNRALDSAESCAQDEQ
jgi:hypothetical protein